MGALRLYEETCELEEESTSYPVLLEEYTSSNIDRIINFGPHKRILRFFIFGNNAHFISSLCKPEKIYPKLSYVSREAFLDLYEKVKYMSSLEIMKKYNVGEDEIDLFFPSLVIVKGFLDLTISSGVYLTDISLREGLMYNLLEKNFNPEAQKEDYEDILSSARHIAKRFKYDKEHSKEIEKFALEIFEAVKNAHELGNREKLLLQLACILHDTGKFLSYENHYKYSADIILALDLVGISEKDLNIVSACAKYHSHVTPGENSYLFDKMKEEDKIVCAKLIAIIRIADALDRSHKGKFENIEVNYTKKEFTITGYSSDDTTLEEWVFTKKATFFAEVFGVMPELIIKGLLNYE
jgi:exopolyphosphatase/guanosine-5'-triphosphate,3'-diphosphate pyrophosphatase